MQEHLRLAMKGDIADNYCGNYIQNKLIELMGEKVKSEVISRAKKSKYYSIIADCTTDISHVELSLTIRFVDLSSNDDKISVKEYFIEFLPANESNGEKLTEVIIDVLNKHGFELNDCRGQGYDNGANMKGKNVGVLKRILDINPLAVYIPCSICKLVLSTTPLITVAIETQKTDVQISREATTLAEQLKDFSFVVSLVVRYGILFQINIVSKSLQSPDIELSKCTGMLKKCCTFLEEYRNTGFKSVISTAKHLAEELEVVPVFKATKRIRFVYRQANETARDEPTVSPENKFKIDFFNSLLDAKLISVNERFEQLNQYSDC